MDELLASPDNDALCTLGVLLAPERHDTPPTLEGFDVSGRAVRGVWCGPEIPAQISQSPGGGFLRSRRHGSSFSFPLTVTRIVRLSTTRRVPAPSPRRGRATPPALHLPLWLVWEGLPASTVQRRSTLGFTLLTCSIAVYLQQVRRHVQRPPLRAPRWSAALSGPEGEAAP